MSINTSSDAILVNRIRQGDPMAWRQLIDRYEQRLLMFAQRRLNDLGRAEDVVQETFIGFFNSLPNYDDRRELQSYLFTIAAHKITDQIRKITRENQRHGTDGVDDMFPHMPDSQQRAASSVARSAERGHLEQQALLKALRNLIRDARESGDYKRIKVLELLFVCGRPNKEVATLVVDITDQQVANFRFAAVKKIKEYVQNAGLCPDVFPELLESGEQ